MRVENSLQKVADFQELSSIVKQAEPKLSWFGKRYIHINNTNQELSIDSLARCMMDLIDQNHNFSEKERPLIKKISDLIDRIYDKSDEQVIGSNLFTRVITWIRHLCGMNFSNWAHCGGYSNTRWFWRECKEINCEGYKHMQYLYTREQFQKVFGSVPNLGKKVAKFGGHPRWLSPETKMFRL